MALDFHGDKDRYFRMQRDNAAEYVIPFIEAVKPVEAGMRVLEIGCAEGGVLLAFLERGCEGIGVELQPSRVRSANAYLKDHIERSDCRVINKNIYDADFLSEYKGYFDLIILKDVIEHIPEQEKVMPHIKSLLRPGGHVFFGFPPWMMPFGGHQQIASSKIAKVPYYHLLPRGVYKWFLKRFGESDKTIEELLEIWDTGISLERFERIAKKTGYSFDNKQLYLINPIYKFKFNKRPRKQAGLIAAIPWFRNYVTTCAYYLLGG